MNQPKLTFFYDGHCPLCVSEVNYLIKQDKKQHILMIDVHSEQFDKYAERIDKIQALEKLHGVDENNTLIYGLDVTYQAWYLIGKSFWFRPLTWTWLRPLLNVFYHFFARYRSLFALLLKGKRKCESCSIKSNNSSKAS